MIHLLSLNKLATWLLLMYFFFQKRAMEAEQETVTAYKQIDQLKKKHEMEVSTLNGIIAESRLPKETIRPAFDDSSMAKYDVEEEPHSAGDQQWREEFQQFYTDDSEISKLAEPSWFSGYDRCNI